MPTLRKRVLQAEIAIPFNGLSNALMHPGSAGVVLEPLDSQRDLRATARVALLRRTSTPSPTSRASIRPAIQLSTSASIKATR